METAAQIRSLRRALNLSQDELAVKAGVAHSTISRVERGLRQVRPETIARIVDALITGAKSHAKSTVAGQ